MAQGLEPGCRGLEEAGTLSEKHSPLITSLSLSRSEERPEVLPFFLLFGCLLLLLHALFAVGESFPHVK